MRETGGEGTRCVHVCVVGARPAGEPPCESESASHTSFLQGVSSSWQRNAWEWAPSVKPTLFQGPGMALGFAFHRFPAAAASFQV